MRVRGAAAHLPVVAEPEQVPVEGQKPDVGVLGRRVGSLPGFEAGPVRVCDHGRPGSGRAWRPDEPRSLPLRGWWRGRRTPGSSVDHDHAPQPELVEADPLVLRQRPESTAALHSCVRRPGRRPGAPDEHATGRGVVWTHDRRRRTPHRHRADHHRRHDRRAFTVRRPRGRAGPRGRARRGRASRRGRRHARSRAAAPGLAAGRDPRHRGPAALAERTEEFARVIAAEAAKPMKTGAGRGQACGLDVHVRGGRGADAHRRDDRDGRVRRRRRQARLHPAGADRGGRRHQPVQLPAQPRRPQDRAGDRGRVSGRAQARVADPALGDQARRAAARRVRPPARAGSTSSPAAAEPSGTRSSTPTSR